MTPEVWLVCLALNVYFESRGEPIEGQYAVAEVTVRRAKLSGRTICEEVFLDSQFSWTRRSDELKVKNEIAWKTAQEVAYHALKGKSNWSKGATHFHAAYVSPKWAESLCTTTKIGRHIFYRECNKTNRNF